MRNRRLTFVLITLLVVSLARSIKADDSQGEKERMWMLNGPPITTGEFLRVCDPNSTVCKVYFQGIQQGMEREYKRLTHQKYDGALSLDCMRFAKIDPYCGVYNSALAQGVQFADFLYKGGEPTLGRGACVPDDIPGKAMIAGFVSLVFEKPETREILIYIAFGGYLAYCYPCSH